MYFFNEIWSRSLWLLQIFNIISWQRDIFIWHIDFTIRQWEKGNMYFRIGDSWGLNVALEKLYYQSFVTNIRRQLVQKLTSRIVKRPNIEVYETLCAFWCHLYHLKNAKNTLLGLLLLTKLQADASMGVLTFPNGYIF